MPHNPWKYFGMSPEQRQAARDREARDALRSIAANVRHLVT